MGEDAGTGQENQLDNEHNIIKTKKTTIYALHQAFYNTTKKAHFFTDIPHI